jgi:hypothetical protein
MRRGTLDLQKTGLVGVAVHLGEAALNSSREVLNAGGLKVAAMRRR